MCRSLNEKDETGKYNKVIYLPNPFFKLKELKHIGREKRYLNYSKLRKINR